MSDDALWIGPCPVEEFLTTFLDTHVPATDAKPRITPRFFASRNISREEHVRTAFGEFINDRKVAPGFELVDTSASHDPNSHSDSQVKPGGNLYRTGVTAGRHRNQMDKVCLLCEFKLGESNDIFVVDDVDGESSDYLDEDDDASSEATANDLRERNKAQIVACLVEMAARQHRTHIFMLFVFHPYARLIRWDRSGFIITEKFSYVDNCSLMVDFFWCFSQVSEAQRGCDTPVILASKEEATHTRKCLFAWAPLDGVYRDVYKIYVPSEGSELRYFLVWDTLAEPPSPFGRGTKGWPALEVKAGKLIETVPVFLKEQWRGKDAKEEVETLKLLNDKGVKFVPTLVCGGDISGDFQTTVAHEYADKSWRSAFKDPELVKKIETRIHVRLVTKEVGRPLETFGSSFEMMKVVYDAFKGHKQAYKLCNLLHRDVSGGNILILDNGDGLLNDWDLAIRLDESGSARAGERTGTWPFMSYDLLANPNKLHTVRDDLESFFWVVLFYGLHYISHTLSGRRTLDDKIYQIFHHCTREEGAAHGGVYKRNLFGSPTVLHLTPKTLSHPNPLEFTYASPLTRFLRTARSLLRSWKIETETAIESPPELETPQWAADPLFKKHEDIEQLYDTATGDRSAWPLNDKAEYQLASWKPTGFRIPTKRKSVDPLAVGSSKRAEKRTS